MADGRSQAISSVGQSQVEPKPSRRLVVSDLDAEVRVNVLEVSTSTRKATLGLAG